MSRKLVDILLLVLTGILFSSGVSLTNAATKRKISVAAEISITFLAYNLKRVMNIFGNEELLIRLRERRKLALG